VNAAHSSGLVDKTKMFISYASTGGVNVLEAGRPDAASASSGRRAWPGRRERREALRLLDAFIARDKEVTRRQRPSKAECNPMLTSATSYSITSSAPASSVAGMVRPSSLAVFRLITSSKRVD
jgi:hypothetical protein